MFCPRCGSQNPEGATACVNCGWVLVPGSPGTWGGPTGAKPDNYLVWAILSTMFCCMPLGIVSIVYAAQVDSRYNTGDLAGAQQSSQNARSWAFASFLCGLIPMLLYLVFVIVMIATGTMSH